MLARLLGFAYQPLFYITGDPGAATLNFHNLWDIALYVIIPVSRVSLGFAAGGGEYEPRGGAAGGQGTEMGTALPFGGGSGAGVSVQPVAFVVVGGGQVRLLPVDSRALYDRLVDLAPQILEHLDSLFGGLKRGGRGRGASAEERGGEEPPRARYRSPEPPNYNPQGRRE